METRLVKTLTRVYPVRVPGYNYTYRKTHHPNYHLGRDIATLRMDQLLEVMRGILDELIMHQTVDSLDDESFQKAQAHMLAELYRAYVHLKKMYECTRPQIQHQFLGSNPESVLVVNREI